jgi:asparagine synthase (glutamine-hydrolysing)
MADAIRHRGPDDDGWFINDDRTVGFGFRRLSIVDLARGHQPMCNEDRSVWIVFNGEIYNHADLRADLQARGHVFHTACDTESIIHLYEEYGLAALDQLRGMFAFAIWDGRARKLILARDRLGIKPLYYGRFDGQFLFGSEIKAILRHPAARRSIDPDGLAQYLMYGVAPAPRTLFAGIHKLEPGHLLVIDQAGQINDTKYWDALPARLPAIDPEEAITEVRRLVDESVRLRMMSDVPVGAFLSGGVDSSTITTLMSKYTDQPVNTFSIGFNNPRGNELQFARQVAEGCHAQYRETIPEGSGADTLLQEWQEIVVHQDEPLADPACLPTLMLSRLVRQSGVIVALVGEGSDELFAGYDRYTDIMGLARGIWPAIWSQPSMIRNGLRLGSERTAEMLNRGRRKAQYFRGAAQRERPFWGAEVALSLLAGDSGWNKVVTPELRRAMATDCPLEAACRHRDTLLASRPDADTLDQITYIEMKIRLAEMLLMRVDKMSMAASIEARVPFLDHKLVEFAMALSLKKNGC